MKHIYYISGFAADERVFAHLDFGDHILHFIPWKIPEKKETISAYAKRMGQSIVHPLPVIMGLSFGGMMSIEVAKQIPVEKVILLSSISTRHELPFYMKFAGTFRLNRIIPMRPYSLLKPLENFNLGVETDEEKKLVDEYRMNIDLRYSNWAIDQVVNWKNTWVPPNMVHIHASNDHIFPARCVKADYLIKGGGHLMLMNKPAEVNAILKKIL